MDLALFGKEERGGRMRPELTEGWTKDHHAELPRLFAMISDLVIVTSREGTILRVNPAWEETLGWTEEELVGHSMFDLVAPEDRRSTAALGASGEVFNFTNRYRHKDGSWRWLLWSGRSDGELWYATAKDVTERLKLERRALYDDLTGLANRALLLDHLRGAHKRLGRSPAQLLAVLFVDLDGFKLVNDGRGHEAGDELLREAASRLRETVRDSDVVGRFGGDEFVIVAEGFVSEAEAHMLAARVVSALSRPFYLFGQRSTISCSVGIATTSDPEAEPDTIVRDADTAMYRAKARGGGAVELFDARARTEVAERVKIEDELRVALADDELAVLYQPVIALGTGALSGCEALVRWRHPREGLLLPERFVPLAEATGLIIDLGSHVLFEACRQAGEWRRQGRNFTVSINVSRKQLLEPGFLEVVRAALKQGGVPGTAICLEVTETAAPARHARLVEVLREVRSLGVKIALDDFGAGYSTLTNLRELPIDTIKVDQSFVAGLSSPGDDRGIVAAVMALARELGLIVVAEGVENEDQLAALRLMGCRYVQGHLFAAAQEPEDVLGGGFAPDPQPGLGDPFVIREFMRQIGIPARIER